MQSQTLDMNSSLCLAQAQYLFYRMAKEKNMKPALLSQIAMQSSIYFNDAFQKNLMSMPLRQFDNGTFSAKLGYHAKYFEAISYWELGAGKFKDAGDVGKGMGEATAYIRMATAKLDEAG